MSDSFGGEDFYVICHICPLQRICKNEEISASLQYEKNKSDKKIIESLKWATKSCPLVHSEDKLELEDKVNDTY